MRIAIGIVMSENYNQPGNFFGFLHQTIAEFKGQDKNNQCYNNYYDGVTVSVDL